METRITATELARSLSDILNRIQYRGERFVVERNGKPIATINPSLTSAITWSELLDRLGDLALPGEGFADDLEKIQSAQPTVGRPKWHT